MFFLSILFVLLIKNITVLPKHYKLNYASENNIAKHSEWVDNILDEGEMPDQNFLMFQNATQNSSDIDFDIIDRLVSVQYPPALVFLGDLYLYGISPYELDHKKAFELFKKASHHNNPVANAQLGFMYQYGLGTTRNLPKAVIYHSLAAQKGDAYSQLWNGYNHLHGELKPKSLNQAYKILYPISEYINLLNNKNLLPLNKPETLTRRLKLKVNKKANEEAIVELLKYKAALGDKGAQLELALVYYYGKYGQEIDLEAARRLFEKNMDNDLSMVFLGRMYHFGEGVPQDLRLAEQYYQEAARMGNPNGFNCLGVMRNQAGDGEAAITNFRRAAAKGHEGAIFNIAMHDLHFPENKTVANENLKALAKSGMIIAQLHVGRSLYHRFDELNENLGVHYISEIVQEGSWKTNSDIAEQYFNSGNFEAALILWLQMSNMGQCVASFNAGIMLENWNKISSNKSLSFIEDPLKTATRMYKRSKRLCLDEDLTPYLHNNYILRGLENKAEKQLNKKFSAPESCFIKIVSMLKSEDVGNVNFMEISELIRRGFEEAKEFALLTIIIMPKIIYIFCQQLYMLYLGTLSAESTKDIEEVVRLVFGKVRFELSMIICIYSLVILVRRRIEIMF